MLERGQELAKFIRELVFEEARGASTSTRYRNPLVGYAPADDPRFFELRRLVEARLLLPSDLLPGAKSVISFFLPFDPRVVEANAQHEAQVAREWAVAYLETNALIAHISNQIIRCLAERGVRGAAEPPTGDYDPLTFTSHWSHKSVAVIAGIGSFGLHHMVITDAGCAGRFGSVVIDANLPKDHMEPKERCLYHFDQSCLECIARCPTGALDESGEMDKAGCDSYLTSVAQEIAGLGLADACGKCAIGPCSFGSAVGD